MADRHDPTLRFLGGAGTVSGSRTLLDTGDERILIDCGLFHGHERRVNWEPFSVDPDSIDAVLLTHAHTDHCGYLPRLVRQGFRGPVYCTEGTRRLAQIVLAESATLLEQQASHANRHGYSKHDPALPLYTMDDAERCDLLFQTVPFDTPIEVAEDINATFSRAGHLLGATWISIEIRRPEVRCALGGDLGRADHPLLLPPAKIEHADIVVIESTYGDEEHHETDFEEELGAAVGAALERDGVAVIPASAVDRVDVVLHHLDRLTADGRLPDVPVFLDAPMAGRAIDVHRDAATAGWPEIRPEMRDRRLFGSLDLKPVRTVAESREINAREGPLVIISASGMATGGRVLHHLAHRIGDERNAVVLVGSQAPGTRGDRLVRGERSIKMLGAYHQVHAEIQWIPLSTHADRSELIDWVTASSPLPRTVYVHHGEPVASRALAEALHDRFGLNAVVPGAGELVRLDSMSWT